MQVDNAPVDSLRLDPRNPRIHSAKNLQAIKDSLTRFGQTKPIVVAREGRTVIAGNGTLEAARALGWTEIAVVWTDLKDQEAVAAGIADNRSAELADWDYQTLSGLLRELSAAEAPIDNLGFTVHELEPLLKADWSPKDAGAMPGHESVGGSSISLSTEQKAAIERAVERVRTIRGEPKMTIGQALEAICSEYLRGPGGG